MLLLKTSTSVLNYKEKKLYFLFLFEEYFLKLIKLHPEITAITRSRCYRYTNFGLFSLQFKTNEKLLRLQTN